LLLSSCNMHETAGAQRWPHVGGRDRGLREQATTEQDRKLVGIDTVIFGLAAVDRLHREGLSQDKGHAFLGAEVGELIPHQHACDGHDDPIPVGHDRLQERVWTGFHVAGTIISPFCFRRQMDMVRACQSMPQSNGCCWV
jgi:hypothetical protein